MAILGLQYSKKINKYNAEYSQDTPDEVPDYCSFYLYTEDNVIYNGQRNHGFMGMKFCLHMQMERDSMSLVFGFNVS